MELNTIPSDFPDNHYHHHNHHHPVNHQHSLVFHLSSQGAFNPHFQSHSFHFPLNETRSETSPQSIENCFIIFAHFPQKEIIQPENYNLCHSFIMITSP